jgi:hypothetical protein
MRLMILILYQFPIEIHQMIYYNPPIKSRKGGMRWPVRSG